MCPWIGPGVLLSFLHLNFLRFKKSNVMVRKKQAKPGMPVFLYPPYRKPGRRLHGSHCSEMYLTPLHITIRLRSSLLYPDDKDQSAFLRRWKVYLPDFTLCEHSSLLLDAGMGALRLVLCFLWKCMISALLIIIHDCFSTSC